MVSTSINFPQNVLDEIDEFVEESNIFENRSQYLRACHREFQDRLESGIQKID